MDSLKFFAAILLIAEPLSASAQGYTTFNLGNWGNYQAPSYQSNVTDIGGWNNYRPTYTPASSKPSYRTPSYPTYTIPSYQQPSAGYNSYGNYNRNSYYNNQNQYTDYRTIDGTGNNVDIPFWGSVKQHLLRIAGSAYEDGFKAMAGSYRPNARLLSNELFATQGNQNVVFSKVGLTDMVWAWGQFVTHDTDLSKSHSPAESAHITVPAGDSTLTGIIGFNRSIYDTNTGTGPGNPREQINEVTSFIDASQVYGSDAQRAAALRTGQGGKMKTSAGDLMPFNTAGFRNEIIGTDPTYFLSGDIRANENLALSSLHVVFLREHNRLAAKIQKENPYLDDEEIYQRARRIVIAQIQAITYNEFLPAILGSKFPSYTGYKTNVNADTLNEFSTAAFRLHTMVGYQLLRLNNNGTTHKLGNLLLEKASLAPATLVESGVDPILKGMATQLQLEGKLQGVDALRNILFGPPGSPGTDIIARDIQRGRDHGLADYNSMRAAYGLSRVTSFQQITKDATVAAKLQSLYGSVDNIDAFVGMFAEDHVSGGSVGPLVKAIITKQFTNWREGDRYWFEKTFSGKELQDIKNTTLSDVIERNTKLTSLQSNVFKSTTKSKSYGSTNTYYGNGSYGNTSYPYSLFDYYFKHSYSAPSKNTTCGYGWSQTYCR